MLCVCVHTRTFVCVLVAEREREGEGGGPIVYVGIIRTVPIMTTTYSRLDQYGK